MFVSQISKYEDFIISLFWLFYNLGVVIGPVGLHDCLAGHSKCNLLLFQDTKLQPIWIC